MANSKFEYVRHFELADNLLPNTWLVVRIDGRGFHRFSQTHQFAKPNDKRAIDLMNQCAIEVMKDIKDIVLAYGQSDEYSFVISKTSNLYSRRSSKICSTIVSLFASNFVYHWSTYFEDKLQYPPCFDSRTICYPNDQVLRDYLSWRQADCHINNLFNTTFWTLVQLAGMTETEAEKYLRGSFAKDKNEILFNHGINYNNISPMYRKGSIIIRQETPVTSISPRDGQTVHRIKRIPTAIHEDLIGQTFWDQRPELLFIK